MQILVIDRESLTNQLITTRLGAKGHAVTAEPNKNAAFDMVREGKFDCILIDPAPMAEARPVIIGVWKNIRSQIKPYIMLLSKTATQEDAILAGTNDVLNKPLDNRDLETKIGNAARLQDITAWLAREDNVHSAGGVIGKAAFHQLFLSAIDRAFRYAERSLIVFVSVTNRDVLEKSLPPEDFHKLLEKLTSQMTFMRRQSDVIGRLGQCDFGILLQRPQYESEPIDAINRFAETLEKFRAGLDGGAPSPEFRLTLVELPQGAQHAERLVPLPAAAVADGAPA